MFLQTRLWKQLKTARVWATLDVPGLPLSPALNEDNNWTWPWAFNPTLSDGHMATSSLVLFPVFRGEPHVGQPQLYLGLSDWCPCQGRPKDFGLFPQLSEETLPLSRSLSNTHFFSSLFFYPRGFGCEVVTLLDTQTQQESIAMNTCVKAATGVQPWYMALHTHLEVLRILCHPKHQQKTLCESYACRVCCCAAVLYHYGTFLQRVPLIQLQI